MNCDQVKNKLVDRYFEDASRADLQEIDEHLQNCSTCFQEYLSIKRSVEYVDSALSQGFKENDARRQAIKADLKKEYKRSFGQLLSIRIPAYAAVAGIAAAILLTLLMKGSIGKNSSATIESAPEEFRSAKQVDNAREDEQATAIALTKYYDSIALHSKDIF